MCASFSPSYLAICVRKRLLTVSTIIKYTATSPAKAPNSQSGGGVKPKSDPAIGMYGMVTATSTTLKQRTIRPLAGVLFQNGLRLVRITKTTKTWVTIDYKNQPVWKRAG